MPLTLRELSLSLPEPKTLASMWSGGLTAAVVKGAIEPSMLAAFRERLERGSPRRSCEQYPGTTFGSLLVVGEHDEMDLYFADADALATAAEAAGVLAKLTSVLGVLTELRVGRPKDGARTYAPFTLRELPPGTAIDVHCERETTTFPRMRALAQQIDVTTIVSFYIPTQLPAAGGELIVYDVRYREGFGERLRSMARAAEHTLAALAEQPQETIHVDVGDLLVFDAGRSYHRVTPVEGDVARWTLGGFLARHNDGRLVFWS